MFWSVRLRRGVPFVELRGHAASAAAAKLILGRRLGAAVCAGQGESCSARLAETAGCIVFGLTARTTHSSLLGRATVSPVRYVGPYRFLSIGGARRETLRKCDA